MNEWPRFELSRVDDDGSSSPPEVIPLFRPGEMQADRRGFLRAGLTIGGALALMAKAGGEEMPVFGSSEAGVCSHAGRVRALAFSPDGALLASAGDDKTVKFWSMPRGALLEAKAEHGNWVWALRFSPDGGWLASGGDDGVALLWSVAERKVVRTFGVGSAEVVHALAFAPDGRTLVTGGSGGSLIVWDVATGSVVRKCEVGSQCRALAFTTEGALLLSGHEDNTIRVWNAATGTLVKTLLGHAGTVWSLAVSGRAPQLFSAGDDRKVRCWSLPAGGVAHAPLEVPAGELFAVAVAPEVGLLAAGGRDGDLRLWPLPGLDTVRSLPAHGDGIWAIAWSPQGKLLATGGADKKIKLWSLPEARVLTTLIDLKASSAEAKGVTYRETTVSGQVITYTLPCGSPIPAGATCTCNCVPGGATASVPAPPRVPVPTTTRSGGTYCRCNKICTCVPVRSDRAAKENFAAVDRARILAGAAALPLSTWNYRDEAPGCRHIGPMAQDFAAAFGVGGSDRHIEVVDAIGVAFACIQELERLVQRQAAEIAALRRAAAAQPVERGGGRCRDSFFHPHELEPPCR
jgi:hypothetical protein